MTEPASSPVRERSSGLSDVVWFAVALATYVVLGYNYKSIVLNWLVGPTYLLFFCHLVPQWVRRLAARWRA